MFGSITANLNNYAGNNPFLAGCGSFIPMTSQYSAPFTNPFMSCFNFNGDIASLNLFNGMNYGSYTNFMTPMALPFMPNASSLYALPLCPSIYDAYGSFASGGGMPFMPFMNFMSGAGSSGSFQFSVPTISVRPSSVSPSTSTTGTSGSSSSSSSSGGRTVKRYGKDLSAEFISRTKQIAMRVGCNYDDLLAVMNLESGLNPQAENKSSGAVGLIQFTGVAIQAMNKKYGLNLTKDKIKNMSAIEQLDLVEKFILMNKSVAFSSNARLSGADLYSLIFLPGRASRDVLTQCGEGYYNANKGLDYDGDGKITKADLARKVESKKISLVA